MDVFEGMLHISATGINIELLLSFLKTLSSCTFPENIIAKIKIIFPLFVLQRPEM